MNITGKPPIAITSYSNFEANDNLLKRYLMQKGFDVPYFKLDALDEVQYLNLSRFFGEVDFVSAVPPCNALSQAAQRKAGTRGTAAPNEWMYKSANFILGDIQPIIYAFENAPALFTGSGEEVRKRLIEIGDKFGYSITFYKTNTLKHGLPQFRPRTFGIFYKGDCAPILNSYNKPYTILSEFLKEIPKEASLQDEYMLMEWDISKYAITKYFVHKYGENWRKVLFDRKTHTSGCGHLLSEGLFEEFLTFQKSLPDASEIVTKAMAHIWCNWQMNRNSRVSYQTLGLDKDYVYAVIGEMMTRQVHPTENRLINIREFMHLMGLPHDYELEDTNEYVKITQNVPVKTCEDLTTEIIEIIKGNRLFATKSVYMQDNSKEINKSKKLF